MQCSALLILTIKKKFLPLGVAIDHKRGILHESLIVQTPHHAALPNRERGCTFTSHAYCPDYASPSEVPPIIVTRVKVDVEVNR